jgi:hypothetical protein
VLSRQEVWSRLERGFVGLRFDWEQGNHYKDRFGFILGTGDQMILDPAGESIRHDAPRKDGRPDAVYGRHGKDTTPELLDEVVAKHPQKAFDLKLEWFLWPSHQARRPGGRYPVPLEAIAQYARMPVATVHGPIPEPLRNADFLRWHVRQFIWVRGPADGPSRIALRRVRDGLKESLATALGEIDGTKSASEIGQALDAAWTEYMKDRPMTARGYVENPHGKWMRGVKDQMIGEDEAVRRHAAAGTLLAPGRAAGEKAPYLK